MGHRVVPERGGRGEVALAGVTLQRRLLEPVHDLVRPQPRQQVELLVALVAAEHFVGVLVLRGSEVVVEHVSAQRVLAVEALVADGAGEGFAVAGHVLLQLVFLMEALVTELTEETLLFVQLPALTTLLLLLLLVLLQICKTSSNKFNTLQTNKTSKFLSIYRIIKTTVNSVKGTRSKVVQCTCQINLKCVLTRFVDDFWKCPGPVVNLPNH